MKKYILFWVATLLFISINCLIVNAKNEYENNKIYPTGSNISSDQVDSENVLFSDSQTVTGLNGNDLYNDTSLDSENNQNANYKIIDLLLMQIILNSILVAAIVSYCIIRFLLYGL